MPDTDKLYELSLNDFNLIDKALSLHYGMLKPISSDEALTRDQIDRLRAYFRAATTGYLDLPEDFA